MVSDPQRFTIDPGLVCDILDDEAILIHVGTGAYYSLRGSAVDMWRGLQAGASSAELGAALAARYDGAPELLRQGLHEFLALLRAEALIHPSDADAAVGELGLEPCDKRAFTAPSLEKFSDMADLLLLDPIHEVDPARGWPQRPGENA